MPKLELEAAVSGVRILSTIMKELSLRITRSTLWTDSQVVLNWLSTTKKQLVFVANRLKEVLASTDAYQWKHVTTKENPADHGTRGLNPDETPAKWLASTAFISTRQLSGTENSPKHVLATHEISRNLSEQIIDPTRFSTWNKLLLTLARYHIIGLRKTLLSIEYRCFLCRRFAAQNIQPVIAPLPACRFPTDSTQYPFANSGVDLFGPFYIEDAKGQIKKLYSLIFTCLVTRCVDLESCPDLNTGTFLNAY